MSDKEYRARRDLKVAKKLMGEETHSEFGSGFLQNILYFYQHFGQREEMQNLYIAQEYASGSITAEEANHRSKRVGISIQFNGTDAVCDLISLFMNGASDHLYDLVIPKNIPDEIREMAAELKETALDMGHGIGLTDRSQCTFEKFKRVETLCIEIIRNLDFHLFDIFCEEGQYQ